MLRDKNQVDFVHAATVMFLSADGKIVRYLNGVLVNPVEMKMAVLDAARGRPSSFMKQGSFMGDVKDFCFATDPQGRGYVLRINNIILARDGPARGGVRRLPAGEGTSAQAGGP